MDRRLGGPQSRSGRGDLEKNSLRRRESNPRTPIVQPVAQRYTHPGFGVPAGNRNSVAQPVLSHFTELFQLSVVEVTEGRHFLCRCRTVHEPWVYFCSNRWRYGKGSEYRCYPGVCLWGTDRPRWRLSSTQNTRIPWLNFSTFPDFQQC